jgi:hypothetical protein
MSAGYRRNLALALLLVACGSKPAPEQPTSFDAAAFASRVHTDLVDLAAVVARGKTNCPQLAVDLRAYWPRLQTTMNEAAQIGEDPDTAQQVTTELGKYTERAEKLQQTISVDLAVCRDDADVREAMRAMPTL